MTCIEEERVHTDIHHGFYPCCKNLLPLSNLCKTKIAVLPTKKFRNDSFHALDNLLGRCWSIPFWVQYNEMTKMDAKWCKPCGVPQVISKFCYHEEEWFSFIYNKFCKESLDKMFDRWPIQCYNFWFMKEVSLRVFIKKWCPHYNRDWLWYLREIYFKNWLGYLWVNLSYT